MNSITLLIITLASCAATTYTLKWSNVTKTAVVTGPSIWGFTAMSNGCTVPTNNTTPVQIQNDAGKLLSAYTGFLANDTMVDSGNGFAITAATKFAANTSVGFSITVSCTTAPVNNISMTAVAMEGTTNTVFASQTVYAYLSSGVEHILSIIGVAMLLLLL